MTLKGKQRDSFTLCVCQVLFWGLRELKKVQFLSVDRPQVRQSQATCSFTGSLTGDRADQPLVIISSSLSECRAQTLLMRMMMLLLFPRSS